GEALWAARGHQAESDRSPTHFVERGANGGEVGRRPRRASTAVDQGLEVVTDVGAVDLVRRATEPAEEMAEELLVAVHALALVEADFHLAADGRDEGSGVWAMAIEVQHRQVGATDVFHGAPRREATASPPEGTAVDVDLRR